MTSASEITAWIPNMIKVASGHYVNLLDPDPETLDIPSISASLSKICRFGGHAPKFYSVAEHCMHAVALAVEDGADKVLQRSLLLHDASEAYLGDVVKPLKLHLPGYVAIEDNMVEAIEKRFGVRINDHHDTIKRYDLEMLKAEKKALWPDCEEEWGQLRSVFSRAVHLSFLSPAAAERQFLGWCDRLQLR